MLIFFLATLELVVAQVSLKTAFIILCLVHEGSLPPQGDSSHTCTVSHKAMYCSLVCLYVSCCGTAAHLVLFCLIGFFF